MHFYLRLHLQLNHLFNPRDGINRKFLENILQFLIICCGCLVNNLLFSSGCTLERGAGYCTYLAILDKSPWDSDAVFIIFCNFWLPYKTMHPFQNFPAALSRSPVYRILKLGNILDTFIQRCLHEVKGERGWGRRSWYVWIEKHPTNVNESQAFCPWL